MLAYIATSKRGKRRLVFAESAGHRNAELFGETLEPLVSADWKRRAEHFEERFNALWKENNELLAKLATLVNLPVDASPAMIYALWAHRQDMRGQSENKIAEISYQRLRQVINGTAQPQSEWGRPSKYGFTVEGDLNND